MLDPRLLDDIGLALPDVVATVGSGKPAWLNYKLITDPKPGFSLIIIPN